MGSLNPPVVGQTQNMSLKHYTAVTPCFHSDLKTIKTTKDAGKLVLKKRAVEKICACIDF